jgi:anthranilate phosphoribosyltransferase
VSLTLGPRAGRRQVAQEAGITFCFANAFHPSMSHAAPPEADSEWPRRSTLLGPLTNPAQPTWTPRSEWQTMRGSRRSSPASSPSAARAAAVFRGRRRPRRVDPRRRPDLWWVRERRRLRAPASTPGAVSAGAQPGRGPTRRRCSAERGRSCGRCSRPGRARPGRGGGAQCGWLSRSPSGLGDDVSSAAITAAIDVGDAPGPRPDDRVCRKAAGALAARPLPPDRVGQTTRSGWLNPFRQQAPASSGQFESEAEGRLEVVLGVGAEGDVGRSSPSRP